MARFHTISPQDAKLMEAALRSYATAAMAAYPQYDGAFADPAWRLMQATRKIESKGGTRWYQGDLVFARPDQYDSGDWSAFDLHTLLFVLVGPTGLRPYEPVSTGEAAAVRASIIARRREVTHGVQH